MTLRHQFQLLSLILIVAIIAIPMVLAANEEIAQRVIIRVSRTSDIHGFVEQEDEDIITIRTPKGEVKSFSKVRLQQIIRLADPSPGQKGVAILNDGQLREGVIIEDAFEHVLIEIEGIRAKLHRSTVSHVILEPTFEQRYEQFKLTLQPGMFDAHLALCRWLIDERRYELARTEILEILIQQELPEARRLLTLVEAQLSLSEKPAKSASDSNDSDEEERSAPFGAEFQPISRDDVNIIRVYEIDFDEPPRISISPDTIRTLIENYGSNELIPSSQTERNAMFRADPVDLVRLMFELRARELYSQIEVKSEPHALNLFRQRIHDTWLINKCATTRCHGGNEAGRFALIRRNYKDDRVRYTNFLILERLQIDPDWPLINYDEPEKSLIIQYGLSRQSARMPHPLVEGWKPIFSIHTPQLQASTIEWIDSMMKPRPDYPVQFDPAEFMPATMPQDTVEEK